MSQRLASSAAVREKRLARLLAERGLERDDPRLASLVEDALLLGSLELAGVHVPWEAARGAPGPVPPQLLALRRARAAVAPTQALTLDAFRAWHAAIAGPVGFRRGELAPAAADGAAEPGPKAAPVAFVAERLASLLEWLSAPGSDELGPEQKAALTLARVVEIRPFDDANGRVSRLAAAHLMARAGHGVPILVGGDAPRLRATLQAAFRLDTLPLVDLIREASGRSRDVMIQSLERGLV